MATPEQDDKVSSNTSWLHQYYTDSKVTGDAEIPPTIDGMDGSIDQPAPLAPPSAPAEKYQLREELGTGGMKTVRRAHDQNTDRDVALARLRDGKLSSRQMRRFLREARITAALEHPNIVPVHDLGVDETGQPYFTMKLLGGRTLQEIIKRIAAGDAEYVPRYPLARRLQIFLNVCDAVAFAHSRGVVHLDLKPANVQVGDFGEVLVLDWGLAKVLDADPERRPQQITLPEELRVVHTDGVVRGTPGHMSPEQARADFATLDERTDVFALGVMLSTLLVCKFPGRAADGAPEFDRAESRRVAPALEAVAAKALAVNPADRYPSVRELAREVRAFLGGFATTAQQATLLTLLWLLMKRHRVAALLAAASSIVIVTISAVAFVRITRSERATRQALQQIRTEQDARRRLGMLAAHRVLQQANNLVHAMDYDDGMQQVDFALTLNSDISQAWNLKAELLLGRWEFDKALTAFDRAQSIGGKPSKRERKMPTSLNYLPDVALKYEMLTEQNGGSLSRDRQFEFVADVAHLTKITTDSRQRVLGQFFQKQNRHADLTAVDYQLIEDALKLLNPDANDLTFDYDGANDSLSVRIRGKNVTQLLPLTGLAIASLDVAGTAVTDLTPLRGMPLESLDLSDTQCREVALLADIPSLTELRLLDWPRQFFYRLRGMNQLERVIVTKADVPFMIRELRPHMRKPPAFIAE